MKPDVAVASTPNALARLASVTLAKPVAPALLASRLAVRRTLLVVRRIRRPRSPRANVLAVSVTSDVNAARATTSTAKIVAVKNAAAMFASRPRKRNGLNVGWVEAVSAETRHELGQTEFVQAAAGCASQSLLHPAYFLSLLFEPTSP